MRHVAFSPGSFFLSFRKTSLNESLFALGKKSITFVLETTARKKTHTNTAAHFHPAVPSSFFILSSPPRPHRHGLHCFWCFGVLDCPWSCSGWSLCLRPGMNVPIPVGPKPPPPCRLLHLPFASQRLMDGWEIFLSLKSV